MEKCDIAIAKWMMDASVPFNAVNSSYYQPMIDVIAIMVAGYIGSNYARVLGYLLRKLVEDVRKMIEGHRTVFLNLVNALFKLFRDVVLFFYLENIVHIVMDKAANYDIGKLEESDGNNFVQLQLVQKDTLRAMVTSREWTSLANLKDKGKKFVDQVLDSKFWI
ncbi:hypothetical protein AHAS_Ahas13G0335400 [Arachis hypogaea]